MRTIFSSILVLSLIISISCQGYKVATGIGEKVILPCDIPDDYSICFIHVIRGQDCSPCHVGTLYMWKETIKMVGREDCYYLFIVEPNPGDDEEAIWDAFLRHPIQYPLYIDSDHYLLEHNIWLKNNNEIDGFVISPQDSRVITIGNPMTSFEFLKTLKSLDKDT